MLVESEPLIHLTKIICLHVDHSRLCYGVQFRKDFGIEFELFYQRGK